MGLKAGAASFNLRPAKFRLATPSRCLAVRFTRQHTATYSAARSSLPRYTHAQSDHTHKRGRREEMLVLKCNCAKTTRDTQEFARRALTRNCAPCFDECDALLTHKDQVTREVVEAHHIDKNRGKRVSQPSLTLEEEEKAFSDATQLRTEVHMPLSRIYLLCQILFVFTTPDCTRRLYIGAPFQRNTICESAPVL